MHIRRMDGTYRYVDPVLSGNGKLKPSFCVVDGKSEHHPEGVYNLRYLGREGKRVWQPVGNDAGLAMLEKRKKESELAARMHGLLVEDTQPVSAGVKTASGVTVGEAIAKYMAEQVRLNRPPGTTKEYARTLRYFEKSCGSKKPLAEVRKSDLIDYMVFLRGLGTLSERSVSNLLTNVQSFLKENEIRIVIKKNERPKPIIKVPDDYERESLDYLLRFASQDEKDMLTYFLCTGQRESEVTFATWANVNFSTRQCAVTAKPELGFRMKTTEEGNVNMPDRLFDMLKARKTRIEAEHKGKTSTEADRLQDLIFRSPKGKPQRHFLRILKRLALKAGLNCGHCYCPKTVKRAGVKTVITVCCKNQPCCHEWKLHKFRRTYATRLSDANVPVDQIRQSLRHKRVETTQLYLAPHILKSAEARRRINQAFA
jgi:integrase